MNTKQQEWLVCVATSVTTVYLRSQGIDPRDAVSRALTSSCDSGCLAGDKLGVPTDILQAVPANFDTSTHVVCDGVELNAATVDSINAFLTCMAAASGKSTAELIAHGQMEKIPMYLAQQRSPASVAASMKEVS